MKKICLFFIVMLLFSSIYGQSKQNIPLSSIAEQTGSLLFWDPLAGNGVLKKGNHQVSFRIDDMIMLLDYQTLAVIEPPVVKDGVVYVSSDFQTKVLELYQTTAPDSLFKIGAILIDAGHGGKDPGAVAIHEKDGKKVTVQEKDITLTVAKDLYSMLKKNYPDKQIILTRDKDIFLSLEQRVDIANSLKLDEHEAILYVSIHANSGFDKKASGFEVWYLSPGYRRNVLQDNSVQGDLREILNAMTEEEYTSESIMIAQFISSGLQDEIGDVARNRGLKEEEWFVVRNANMPSVLIEVGFVTNKEEALLLDSKIYLRKVSTGIYNGLSMFVTSFEHSRGFTGTK